MPPGMLCRQLPRRTAKIQLNGDEGSVAISDTSIVAPLRALQNFISILVLTVSLEEMAVAVALSTGRSVAGRGIAPPARASCCRAPRRSRIRRPPAPSNSSASSFSAPNEEDEDIADPLNYTVTLTVEGDDEKLKETLDKASSLVQDVERPVSGSLGLLAKARSDREQLVAALYREARYDGVVEIVDRRTGARRPAAGRRFRRRAGAGDDQRRSGRCLHARRDSAARRRGRPCAGGIRASFRAAMPAPTPF